MIAWGKARGVGRPDCYPVDLFVLHYYGYSEAEMEADHAAMHGSMA